MEYKWADIKQHKLLPQKNYMKVRFDYVVTSIKSLQYCKLLQQSEIIQLTMAVHVFSNNSHSLQNIISQLWGYCITLNISDALGICS